MELMLRNGARKIFCYIVENTGKPLRPKNVKETGGVRVHKRERQRDKEREKRYS